MTDKPNPKEASQQTPTDTDKINAVLAILGGKAVREEANNQQVDLAEMTTWLNDFITAGTAALKRSPSVATDHPSRRRVVVAVMLALCLAAVMGVASANVFSDRRIYMGRFALAIPKDTEFGRKDNGSYELFGAHARANTKHLMMTPRMSAVGQIAAAAQEWFPQDSRACLIGAPASGRFQEERLTWAVQRYVQTYYSTGGPATSKFVGYFVLLVERDGGALVLDVYGNDSSPNHNGGWEPARTYLVQLSKHLEPPIRASQLETLDAPKIGAKCLGPSILNVPVGTKAKQGSRGGFQITSKASEVAADVAYRRMKSPERSTAPDPSGVFDSIKKRWFAPTSCVTPQGDRLEYLVQPKKDPSLTFPVGTRMQQRYEKQVDGKIATHGVLAIVSLKKTPNPEKVDRDMHRDGDVIVIDVFAAGAATGPNDWKSVDGYMRSVEQKLMPDALFRPVATQRSAKKADGDGRCSWSPSQA